MTVHEVRVDTGMSVRRIANALVEPVSTVGRWIQAPQEDLPSKRQRPVAGDEALRGEIRSLCQAPRHHRYGYRRIRAMYQRKTGRSVNRKTVWRIMREEGLCQERSRHRPHRPKRVEKMRPTRPNEAWQIDMTCFQMSNLTALYLVLVTDCHTREIVGWTLDQRCRASEWVSAVRRGLETRRLNTKDACAGLTVRSDNGAQPCSKKFVEYLGACGVRGQYTGYNAPDDNAYVERVIRTIKEEEIWLNEYDMFSEAHAAIDEYVRFYNEERIHSSLGYRTPKEFAAAFVTLTAA